MKAHPAAELFPAMDLEDVHELARDIQANGLLEPIVTYQGQVLDGRNRLAACRLAEVEPRFREWDGTSPTAYALSVNLHRRHLTAGQKAMVAADALPMFEAEAKQRQRQGAAIRESRKSDENLVADPPQGPDTGKAREHAARAAGVGARSVQAAKRLTAEAPDLAGKVRDGITTLNAASRELDARRTDAALASLDAGASADAQRQAANDRLMRAYTRAMSRTRRDLLPLKAEDIGALVWDDERAATQTWISDLRSWLDRLERSLRRLHVVDGGAR